MRLYIIRHADPDYPNNTITPEGHIEAQALGRRMAKLGLDRIYCSPLGRAIDTARYTCDALGMEPIIEPWTAELSWAHLGSDIGAGTPWDIHPHTIRQPDLDLTRTNWHEFSPLNVPEIREGYAHIQQNSDEFLARHGYERKGGIYHIRQPNREKIAVFCHGGFGLTWLAHLLYLPLPLAWISFFLPTSSVTTILFDERNSEVATPRCIGMGDLSHHYMEDLEMQRVGIKANHE